MTLADQVVVLDRGRVQQIGHPQEIYAHPANRMVATFLGNPPMNVLNATYLDGSFIVNNQSFPVPQKMKQQLSVQLGQIALGIRPEAAVPGVNPRLEAGELTIEVDVVEPLGRETLIRGKLPDDVIFHVIAPADWRGKRGDRLTVQFDLDRLFVFDANDGQTLYPTINR